MKEDNWEFEIPAGKWHLFLALFYTYLILGWRTISV